MVMGQMEIMGGLSCLVGPIVLRDPRNCRPQAPIARPRAVHEAELPRYRSRHQT